MSGLEVAGLTLAVFPILVNGMVRFVDGIQTIRYWRRYRVKLQDYADIVESQRVYYQDTLEELLTGIVQSEDEIKDLIEQPRGALWKKPEYEEKLRQRLGRSYAVYLNMSNKMTNALFSMCAKLEIDCSGKLLPDESWSPELVLKRIKFTLLKNVYSEILNVIDKANKDLRDITHQNVYLEPIRQKRRSKRPLAQLKLIRKHATSLHQVLVTGKAWKCSCKMIHVACLRLESRPDALEAANVDSVRKVRFRILLSRKQNEKSLQPTFEWQEFEIVPSLDEGSSGANSVGPQNSTRTVRFGPDQVAIATAESVPEPTIDRRFESIGEMCSTVCASPPSEKALGFLVDHEDDKHKHHLYRTDSTMGPETQTMSLGHLLSCSGHGPHSASLSKNDRLRIAVTLASSVLQLDGTSWLKPQWSSKDIFFHEKNKQASDIDYWHPYVFWKLCVADKSTPDSSETSGPRKYMIRSEVLYALGLTLIELCFGKALADMHIPEDGDPNEATTEMTTAYRLCGSVFNEMGEFYDNAVRRCLHQPFDVRDMSLDNEELQQLVFDGIVTPLNDDFLNFNGKSRIR